MALVAPCVDRVYNLVSQILCHIFTEKFWTAPELLNHAEVLSPHGDIYGLGIIISEVITRQEPYEDFSITSQGQ